MLILDGVVDQFTDDYPVFFTLILFYWAHEVKTSGSSPL